MKNDLILFFVVTLARLNIGGVADVDAAESYMELRVIDDQTGRGIPLVELQTVHRVSYWTDSAGRIAYREPSREGESIFFSVRSPGYEFPQDGFGFAGTKIVIRHGGSHEIKMTRTNIAERLYRCTGQDIYRDSDLLGREVPIAQPLGTAGVAGQDSVFAVVYRERLRWFWGDTNRLSYPLGIFRMAGATSPLPDQATAHHRQGINYDYFTSEDGFARNMAEVDNPQGVVWLDGICVMPLDDHRDVLDRDELNRDKSDPASGTAGDPQHPECMIAHYSRRKGLGVQYEHGMMVYDDDRDVFVVKTQLPDDDTWRHLSNHPIVVSSGDAAFQMCGIPFPVTRVENACSSALDPAKYESFSCVDVGADPRRSSPRRDGGGNVDWRWQTGPPTTQRDEWRWLKSGELQAEECRFLPADMEQPGRHVLPHSGTVRWNAWRRKWVMIAVEIAQDSKSPSHLGEVWYSEADSPQGPFRQAVRIVTHEKQTFYNPCHHDFFDEDGGRVIYFEGTYCNTFTDAPPTPRYDYNQVMYRLDLADPRIARVFAQQ